MDDPTKGAARELVDLERLLRAHDVSQLTVTRAGQIAEPERWVTKLLAPGVDLTVEHDRLPAALSACFGLVDRLAEGRQPSCVVKGTGKAGLCHEHSGATLGVGVCPDWQRNVHRPVTPGVGRCVSCGHYDAIERCCCQTGAPASPSGTCDAWTVAAS